MRIINSCAECLYNKQMKRTDDAEYLAAVKSLLDNRTPEDCSPYLAYRFNQIYESKFGKKESFRDVKKQYNDLALSMEEVIRSNIEKSEDPVATAVLYSRAGNYIDFAALSHVDEKTFLELLDNLKASEKDVETTRSFIEACEHASTLLILADNCGEILFDKLLIEQLKKRFPQLSVSVMVRGDEIHNDATVEDAEYVGIDKVAKIIPNGKPIAGTVYHMLTDEAKEALDTADVILSKGQGNYESLNGSGRHIFYLFLCKCDLFINRFQVPQLTGMFVEEKAV